MKATPHAAATEPVTVSAGDWNHAQPGPEVTHRIPAPSAHPYASAQELLDNANRAIAQANERHNRAARGLGSDTETARAARATIALLNAYLDEVSQPRHDDAEDTEQTAHAAAASRYEDAKRAAEIATEEARRAYDARDAADHAAEQAHDRANKAATKARTAAATVEAAQRQLQRHQDARDTAREEEGK